MLDSELLNALRCVLDPDLGRSIVELNMLRDFSWNAETGQLGLTCELTTPACPVKDKIEADIRAEVARSFPEIKEFKLAMTAKTRGLAGGPGGTKEKLCPQIQHVILIGSGKGGEGKSTLALNLALALNELGAKAHLLDLDIYAPTLPALLGPQPRPQVHNDQQIRPLPLCGMETMSLGFLVEPRQGLAWRGQTAPGLIAQFMRDVVWSPADYLIVDLPTGAGDVPLYLAQHIQFAGVALVTTPTPAGRMLAWRVHSFWKQMNAPLLGWIENFSSDRKSAEAFALETALPLLSTVPVEPLFHACEMNARPFLLEHPKHMASLELKNIAAQLAARSSTLALQPA